MNQYGYGSHQQLSGNIHQNYPQHRQQAERMPKAPFPNSGQTPGMPTIGGPGQLNQPPSQMTPATRYLAIT